MIPASIFQGPGTWCWKKGAEKREDMNFGTKSIQIWGYIFVSHGHVLSLRPCPVPAQALQLRCQWLWVLGPRARSAVVQPGQGPRGSDCAIMITLRRGAAGHLLHCSCSQPIAISSSGSSWRAADWREPQQSRLSWYLRARTILKPPADLNRPPRNTIAESPRSAVQSVCWTGHDTCWGLFPPFFVAASCLLTVEVVRVKQPLPESAAFPWHIGPNRRPCERAGWQVGAPPPPCGSYRVLPPSASSGDWNM